MKIFIGILFVLGMALFFAACVLAFCASKAFRGGDDEDGQGDAD